MKTQFSVRPLVGRFVLPLVVATASLFASPSAGTLRALECGIRLCFNTPQYYEFNYFQLNFNGADIFISGVNLNHPVDSRDAPELILFALRGKSLGPPSPLTQFNQHYVAAQLTQAQAGLLTAVGARNSQLSCYPVNFTPVQLSTGVTLTPEMTLGEFFTQCDLVGLAPYSAARDADMLALVQVLAQLNTCGAAAGPACNYVSAPTRQSFAAHGGSGSFTVTSINGCAWTATSNDPSWITITSGASGSGSGTVNYTVAAHNNSTRRSGTITLGGGLTFTVLQGAQFNDVPTTHPLYIFIGQLSARGITNGCGEGNFCPDAPVSREQAALFIERSLGVFNPPAPAQQTFQDVPVTRFGYPFIEDFVARGISLGCAAEPPRLYCPDAPMTREQVALFILRALGLFTPPPGPAMPTFADVPNSGATDFSYEFIEEFYRRGITSGCQAGPPRLYCPAAVVRRGQMALFLVRAFNL